MKLRSLNNRVIGKVPKDEQRLLDETAKRTADAVKDIIALGIDNAMNRHNYVPKKQESKDESELNDN